MVTKSRGRAAGVKAASGAKPATAAKKTSKTVSVKKGPVKKMTAKKASAKKAPAKKQPSHKLPARKSASRKPTIGRTAGNSALAREVPTPNLTLSDLLFPQGVVGVPEQLPMFEHSKGPILKELSKLSVAQVLTADERAQLAANMAASVVPAFVPADLAARVKDYSALNPPSSLQSGLTMADVLLVPQVPEAAGTVNIEHDKSPLLNELSKGPLGNRLGSDQLQQLALALAAVELPSSLPPDLVLQIRSILRPA